MSRRDAREAAFMLLYQIEIQKGDEDRQLAEFIEQREVQAGDVPYMQLLFDGVRMSREMLDATFSPYLKRWTKSRLPKIDLTILRLAVFEICSIPDVPDNVAISEAVLLARKFSSEESRSYINAVLGRLHADRERAAGREPSSVVTAAALSAETEALRAAEAAEAALAALSGTDSQAVVSSPAASDDDAAVDHDAAVGDDAAVGHDATVGRDKPGTAQPDESGKDGASRTTNGKS